MSINLSISSSNEIARCLASIAFRLMEPELQGTTWT